MVFAKLFEQAKQRQANVKQQSSKETVPKAKKHENKAKKAKTSSLKKHAEDTQQNKRSKTVSGEHSPQVKSLRTKSNSKSKGAANKPPPPSKSNARSPSSADRPIGGRRHRSNHQASSSKSEADASLTRKRRRHSSYDHTERRAPPSQAALRLSQQLQDCSRHKRLDEALALYWNHEERDQHHACILIDCCARCGAVDQAERIVEDLQQHGETIHVATHTALLKGYAHAGKMHSAAAVWDQLCDSLQQRPNVRTLNTLLRGCLWTAAARSTTPRDATTTTLCGGVVTSEHAWQRYRECVGIDSLDASSYEMSTLILCQALQTRAARDRVTEFQQRYDIFFKGTASLVCKDTNQASLETVAVMHLALARAYALQGRSDDLWRAGQRVLSAVQASRAALLGTEDADGATNNRSKKKKQKVQGGKRAWKNSKKDGEDNDEQTTRRAASNMAFRTHRLGELEAEARELLKMRGKVRSLFVSKNDLAQRLLQQLFYFSGGGTTNLEAVHATSNDQTKQDPSLQFLTSAWFSFGLSELVEGVYDVNELSVDRVYDAVGLGKTRFVQSNGFMNFDAIFPSNQDRPLDIELGSGFGDWVVRQARSEPTRNYVAVELRSDRVSQIFSKAALEGGSEPLQNVCVVGSECGSFLRDRVKSESVATIFANFPEPPTQSYGVDGNSLESIMVEGDATEPAHMLNSSTLITAARCLKVGGRIVVVTDNRLYARLLCATFVKATRKAKGLLRSPGQNEIKNSGLRQVEAFPNNSSKDGTAVLLYEGQPNQVIGHVMTTDGQGASYFDRLWRSGASSHSERRHRFVIVMCRI